MSSIFFNLVQIPFLEYIFIRGRILLPKTNPVLHKRLVLASVPCAPHERFFHYGQKHTSSNFIRGILRGGICTSDSIYQGHMPFMSSCLDTPLVWIIQSICKRIYIILPYLIRLIHINHYSWLYSKDAFYFFSNWRCVAENDSTKV